MKRFKAILFVCDRLDGPDPAYERACALAIRNGASLTVAMALRELPEGELAGHVGQSCADIVLDYYRQHLAAKVDDARASGLNVSSRLLIGSPFVEIIREVLEQGHDLVMKTAEPTVAHDRRGYGATDMHLMRKCPCPVWLIRPEQRHSFGRILVAVDAGHTDSMGHALNIKLLQLGTSLAAIEQSALDVVYCWHMPGETILRGRAFARETMSALESQIDHEQVANEQRLEALVRSLPELPAEPSLHVVKGTPEIAIPAMAETAGTELVVMGSLSRSGIAGVFIGNTAEAVLPHLSCSMMTVKPEGFRTPIRLDTAMKRLRESATIYS
ncbi:MAG: universal stress protein [Geminicoccaceae bacterium]